VQEVNLNIARQIQDIGPFGETNPEPLFLLKDVQIRDIMQLSHGKHLKLYVQKVNQIFECVWWGAGQYKDAMIFGEIVDIVFKLSVNSWQGTDRIQLTIEDLRSSEVQDI
jgi:single-stranded-DNA-specific exonuclease